MPQVSSGAYWNRSQLLSSRKGNPPGKVKTINIYITRLKPPYKGSIKEQDIGEHRPNNGGQVRNVQESRTVPLHKEGYDRVAEKVEGHKAQIVEHNARRVARSCVRKRSILSKDNHGLERGNQEAKQTEET